MKAERGRDRRCTMEEVWTGSLTERERAAEWAPNPIPPAANPPEQARQRAHVRRARARRAHGARLLGPLPSLSLDIHRCIFHSEAAGGKLEELPPSRIPSS